MKKMNKKGFTIVELVIVIAVIAILAAVMIPTFSGIVDKANQSAAIQQAEAQYKEDLVAIDAQYANYIAKGTYVLTTDTKVVAGTTYYAKIPTAVTPAGTENPKTEGWYESTDGAYTLTEDTSVGAGKTYYTVDYEAVENLDTDDAITPNTYYVDTANTVGDFTNDINHYTTTIGEYTVTYTGTEWTATKTAAGN